MHKGWLKILLAAVLEIMWITGLKYAAGSVEWMITIAAWALCSYCFITASEVLPVGTAYCVFTGLGALGTVLVEVCYFQTALDNIRLLLIGMLMTGIIGLKLCTDKEQE